VNEGCQTSGRGFTEQVQTFYFRCEKYEDYIRFDVLHPYPTEVSPTVLSDTAHTVYTG
jgi:hypothetical protein